MKKPSVTLWLVVVSWLMFQASAAAGWRESLDRVEEFLAAGDSGSAASVLTATLTDALSTYAKADTSLVFSTCREGIRREVFFPTFVEAESLYTRALDLKKRLERNDDAETALILLDLAMANIGGRNFDEAVSLMERALSIQEEVLGPDHIDVAWTVGALGSYNHYILAEYATAESLYRRALSIQERAFGPDHESLTYFGYHLGLLLINSWRVPEAIALQQRDLAIKTRVYGPESREVASTLANLLYSYPIMGRHDEAESCGLRALAIYEKEYGPDHLYITNTLDLLGNLYTGLGRYAEAESMLYRSLTIKKMNDSNPWHVARSANSLGNLFSQRGLFADAERYYKQAIEINEERAKTSPTGKPPSDLGVNLYNLANIYRDRGRPADAEPLYRRAIEIWESLFGPHHAHVGGGCIELALLYRTQGRYDEAEPLLHRAVAIADSAFGPGNGDSGRALYGLGVICVDRGQYEEGEAFLREALAIFEPDPGHEAVETPNTLEALVRVYRLKGEFDRAFELAGKAMKMRRRTFYDNVHVLSERDAIEYSQFLRNSIDCYATCCIDLSSTGKTMTGPCADAVLAGKGQVSDGIFDRRRSLVEETDPAILELAGRLRNAKRQLAQHFVNGPGDDREAYRLRADSLSAIANSLEAGLSRLSASFRSNRASREVGAEAIAALLPENAVLIEYVRYSRKELNPERDVPHYLVAVLNSDGLVTLDDLGKADEIDPLVQNWRSHLLQVASSGRLPGAGEQKEYEEQNDAIYEKVWSPVGRYAEGKDLILIAPDGALNLLAFAALRSPGGEYLVEKHALHYLSAGRDLLRLELTDRPGSGLFALGDPDYGASVESRVAALGAPEDGVIQVAMISRNVRSGCQDLSGVSVPALPGTRREVELVSGNWLENIAEPVFTCYGDEASEEYFKAEAPGKRVIHLATHGYFLGGACSPEEMGVDYVGENPLLLSGLFFAGANLHGEDADSLGAEDGILTAYEVSAMDFHGTDLVVLSACETGIGEVAEGEGVYGLRRAFQMAGARTVVSALWPVSDEATAEMMGGLYRRRDESLPEAMRRIQLERLDALRSESRVDHPFTWGPFIALGDWR